MLWSTYPPDALPKVGDLVTLGHGGIPYAVRERTRSGIGQVYLLLDSDPPQRVQVEACHWWPQVGDLCTGVPVPYRQWLAKQWADPDANRWKKDRAYDDFNNGQSWLYGEFTIKSIEGDLATVTGAKFSGTHALPLSACAVLSRPSVQRILEIAA
jgi:hypothetical protein